MPPLAVLELDVELELELAVVEFVLEPLSFASRAALRVLLEDTDVMVADLWV
jgi:hypothetical protein